ncbi:UDP-N-acetylglucosamine 2-epimerase (non-hydrolyzing) [Candidatus Pacearchaeota archaeon]|nr:UDP-N-acetylglucosamine 2-epimerase (non-hydrolyzing) [Candidatus Pacearchaeota archaeon]|tara:strand:+ start:2353 stop:3348 length:996 start_codon:yes stop_codon:yes gene_type:complete
MLLISFGTRPEYIKLKPLIDEFRSKIDFKLLFTGQHTDLLNNIKEDDLIELQMGEGANRLDTIVVSIMNNEEVFDSISSVIVQGDTSSAFSVALAAFHRRIRVIHLEAGLRSFDNDNPYPEEFNRRAISCLSDINLCPTEDSAMNLHREKVPGKIFVVGNSVLDNLINIKPKRTNKVILTLHRRENHGIITSWFRVFDKLARNNPELDFILPIHPNPNVKKYQKMLKYVNVIEPLEHNEFIKLLSESKLVITDSGGLQEESTFFKKKCIVCRKKSERMESMGNFSFLCDVDELEGLFYKVKKDSIPEGDSPYGDGKTAKRVLKILREELNA